MKFSLTIPAAVVLFGSIVLSSACRTSHSDAALKDEAVSARPFVAEYCGTNGFESFSSTSARQICTGKAEGLHPFALRLKVDGMAPSIYEIYETEYDDKSSLRLLLARDGSSAGELTVDFQRQAGKEVYERIHGVIEGIAVDLALKPVSAGQLPASSPGPSHVSFDEKLIETCTLVAKPSYEIGLYSSHESNAGSVLRIAKGKVVFFERRIVARTAGELQAGSGHAPQNLEWYFDIPGKSSGFDVFFLAGSIYRHRPVDSDSGVTFIAPVTLLDLSETVDDQVFKGPLTCKKVI